MKNEITRRRFLGTAATLGAGAVAAPAVASAPVHPPGWSGTARVDKIATTCEMCFWRCGVLASVSGGKVVRVEGNPTIPRARAACAPAETRGRGCSTTRTG